VRKETALKSNVLGTREVLFQAVTHLGPALGLVFLPTLAALVGGSIPFIVAVGLAASFLTALCVVALAKHLPSAGGYYTYVSHGLGERFGLLASWAQFLYDPLGPAFIVLFTSAVLQGVFTVNIGWRIHWWIFALIFIAVLFSSPYTGIKPSARFNLIVGVIEFVIALALGISLIVHAGVSGQSLAPFKFPSHPAGYQPIFIAFALGGVLAFTGFEAAAPLAEETANPKQAIPRSVLISLLAVGVLWIITTYGTIVDYGASKAAQLGTADPVMTLFVLAKGVWGVAWWIAVFALVNSALGAGLANVNGGTRVLYALGRTGVLPQAFGSVHPRFRTPSTAIIAQTLLNLFIILGLGFWIGPTSGYVVAGLSITLGVIVMYSLGNLSVIRLYLTRYRREFNPIRHTLVPLVAVASYMAAFYYSVHPLPTWPVRLTVYVVIGWFALGIFLAFYLWHAHSDSMIRAAAVFAGDIPEPKPAEPPPGATPLS